MGRSSKSAKLDRHRGPELLGEDLVHGADGHRRRRVLQLGEGGPVGGRHLLGQARLEDAHGLPELHGPALELAQGAEDLLGGAGLHLGRHRLGGPAPDPLADPERGAPGDAQGEGGQAGRPGDGPAREVGHAAMVAPAPRPGARGAPAPVRDGTGAGQGVRVRPADAPARRVRGPAPPGRRPAGAQQDLDAGPQRRGHPGGELGGEPGDQARGRRRRHHDAPGPAPQQADRVGPPRVEVAVVQVDAVQARPAPGDDERADDHVAGAHDDAEVRGARLHQRHPRRGVGHLCADQQDEVGVGRAGRAHVRRQPVHRLGGDVRGPAPDVGGRRAPGQHVRRPHRGVVDESAGAGARGGQGDGQRDAQAPAAHHGHLGPGQRPAGPGPLVALAPVAARPRVAAGAGRRGGAGCRGDDRARELEHPQQLPCPGGAGRVDPPERGLEVPAAGTSFEQREQVPVRGGQPLHHGRPRPDAELQAAGPAHRPRQPAAPPHHRARPVRHHPAVCPVTPSTPSALSSPSAPSAPSATGGA